MKNLMTLILVTILSTLISFSSLASTSTDSVGFEISFGPWGDVEKPNRKRMVYLELMGRVIDSCSESIDEGFSDIVESCAFIKEDKKAVWLIDNEEAIKILYHKSGMNMDGSKRYFWHEWFNID